MVLDYSKWDNLEISDDSDIEVHPNVDKRSFIRAKQNQIHQERDQRKHQITTLKYERIINDGLITRIDALLSALKAHKENVENADELVFQALIESSNTVGDDQPPTPPEGVYTKVEEQPTYSKMMATLVDQVKKHVDDTKPDNRFQCFVDEIESHRAKVLDSQQKLLEKLAELEKLAGSKITSESIHTGFNSSYVSLGSKGRRPMKLTRFGKVSKSKASGAAASSSSTKVELLNEPKQDQMLANESADSGAEADVEDGGALSDGRVQRASPLGKAFSKISPTNYQASLQYISENPTVMAERETDGILMDAFDHQLAGRDDLARQCVHQGLLLQYCRSLGRDGVSLFFKRVTTKDHQARKMFYDDVNTTYNRVKERAKEMAKEDLKEDEGAEQIQLHPVNPGQTIAINIPSADKSEDAEARQMFESFPPGLQRALESGSLDEVNKVLGKMSVEEAEEVVGQLSEGGMLSMEEGIIDGTTEEGQQQMREIEKMGKMASSAGEVEGGPGEVVEEMD